VVPIKNVTPRTAAGQTPGCRKSHRRPVVHQLIDEALDAFICLFQRFAVKSFAFAQAGKAFDSVLAAANC
jgi:hypothetical protein